MKNLDKLENHFHFIGIGGIGMSAIALVLAKRGFSISGSDKNQNNAIQNLSRNNVKIFAEQKKSLTIKSVSSAY